MLPVALRTYSSLLHRPGVARLLAAATTGRIPLGMAPLAILLLVRDSSGSYALAGPAAGVLATAALLAVGTLWFALAPQTASAPRGLAQRGDLLGPLRSGGLRRVLASTTLLAVGLGAQSIALPAAADAAGHRSAG